MNLTRENCRRESRAYFRRQITDAIGDADRLQLDLRDTADELRRDGYLDDAHESVTLLRRAGALADEAKRLAAMAEAKLPPVVR